MSQFEFHGLSPNHTRSAAIPTRAVDAVTALNHPPAKVHFATSQTLNETQCNTAHKGKYYQKPQRVQHLNANPGAAVYLIGRDALESGGRPAGVSPRAPLFSSIRL